MREIPLGSGDLSASISLYTIGYDLSTINIYICICRYVDTQERAKDEIVSIPANNNDEAHNPLLILKSNARGAWAIAGFPAEFLHDGRDDE